MATTASAIAVAVAGDARESDPLLSTHVVDDDVEPMSERIPGHSRPAFGSGGHSIRARNPTTPSAPRTSPPFSRRPADVPNGASNPTHLSYHPDVQQRQALPMEDNADQRRYRVALVWSYAPDWACFSLLDYIQGFWREFALTDTTIQHTFTVHERVPDWMLCVLAGFAPMALLSLVNFYSIRSWWDLHSGWLGLLLSLTLTGVVSQAMKVTVGRPRPDLLARCLPKPGLENAPVFGLVTAEICTQTDAFILKDGFRSFPSGHASCTPTPRSIRNQCSDVGFALVSFAGLGFLSFYLAGKIHLFDSRGYTSKALVALTPFIGAALIAISRTMDYRHHWEDVTAGSFLGLVLAFFAYRQYYPPLSSAMSHRPYNPRPLRKKERHSIVNVDPESGLRVHRWGWSAMASEEDLRGHIQYHSHSWHGPSATMSSGAAMVASYAPHSKPIRQAEEAEADEMSEAGGDVPDEERGINKPVLPKSIKEIWREERGRGES